MKISNCIGLFSAGLFTGLIIGITVAPKPGRQLRAELGAQAADLQSQAVETISQVKDSTTTALHDWEARKDELSKHLGESTQQLKRKAQNVKTLIAHKLESPEAITDSSDARCGVVQ